MHIPQFCIKIFLLFCVLSIKIIQPKNVKSLSKYEVRLIAKMRGIKVKK